MYIDLQVFNVQLIVGVQVVLKLVYHVVEVLVLMLVWPGVVTDLVPLIKTVDGSERHQET